MEVNEWPRIGIGNGGSYGELLHSEPQGEGCFDEINSWKDILSKLELGGSKNNESGKNFANGREYGDRKLNAINDLQAYNLFAMKHSCDQSVGRLADGVWSTESPFTRDDELNNDDDRYNDLSNDKARYDKCNYVGYNVDNDLDRYDDAHSCANKDYCNNVGQYNKYNVDDKHEAANNGVDKYGDVNDGNNVHKYNNEVFW